MLTSTLSQVLASFQSLKLLSNEMPFLGRKGLRHAASDVNFWGPCKTDKMFMALPRVCICFLKLCQEFHLKLLTLDCSFIKLTIEKLFPINAA